MKRLFLLAAIMIAASSIAFADLAPPPGKSSNRVKKPDPGISTTLVIKLDRNEKVARLEVPRSQIKQLRAELEQLDTDGNAAGVLTDGAFTQTQTIVSGLFLSLAVVFGGMWFMRSERAAHSRVRTLVAVLAAAGIGSAATIVYANVGPPPDARSITSKLFDQKIFFPYKQASGEIKLATKETGNYVELIVPDVSATPAGEE